MEKYICLDIGASSGKMLIAYIENSKIKLENLHSFSNKIVKKKERAFWNLDAIFNELIIGLKKAKRKGISECNLGIDSWAVDYALIDQDGNLLDDVYSYRDKRTEQILNNHANEFDALSLYMQTGIYPLEFNTLFQLYAHKIWEFKNLDKILLLPDYLIYKMTGKKIAEATNLSSTQLFDVKTQKIKSEILSLLKIDESKFGEIVYPGQYVGQTNSEFEKQYEIPKCQIWSVASHDTASAFAAAPSLSDNSLLISSGTWSLLGTELAHPIVTRETFWEKFTNELGFENRILFLKNIIGMWIIQEIENNLSNKFAVIDLLNEAIKYEHFDFIMDCEDKRYLMPENMIFEIWKYFSETGQAPPYNIGQLIRCVIDSLVLCYNDNIGLLEKITNKKFGKIHIIGGGSKNQILNQTLADISKKEVVSGPPEASMIGNIVAQMIAKKEIQNLTEARKLIKNSFESTTFFPNQKNYQNVINKYNLIKEMRKKTYE